MTSPLRLAKSVTILELGSWLRLGVETWESPIAGQDDVLVSGRETYARLAAIDGVTPVEGALSPLDTDQARYAAAIVRAALADEGTAGDALAAAGRFLHDARLPNSRSQAAAAVVAATISRHGMEIAVAGDCAAYLRRADTWFEIGAIDALTPEANSRWRDWVSQHPDATRAEHHAAEIDLVGSPDDWQNPAVGAFPAAKPQIAFLDNDWDELVLTTDGSRLDVSLLGRLESWLTGLRDWEEAHASELGRGGAKVHDDVTVIRARPLALADDATKAPAQLHRGGAPKHLTCD
jgi:hypothetical protein